LINKYSDSGYDWPLEIGGTHCNCYQDLFRHFLLYLFCLILWTESKVCNDDDDDGIPVPDRDRRTNERQCLTSPYGARHTNMLLLNFVSDFLVIFSIFSVEIFGVFCWLFGSKIREKDLPSLCTRQAYRKRDRKTNSNVTGDSIVTNAYPAPEALCFCRVRPVFCPVPNIFLSLPKNTKQISMKFTGNNHYLEQIKWLNLERYWNRNKEIYTR